MFFKSIIGENLSDYIERIRLSNITLKFKTTQKITQITINSGYATNASFSKEFSLNTKKKKRIENVRS